MDYMTASQAAKKWNISQRRIQVLMYGDKINFVHFAYDSESTSTDKITIYDWI